MAGQSIPWNKLASDLNGQLIRPENGGYEDARKVWNGMIDIKPAAIARCHNVDDVRRAVTFGTEQGVQLSVRGGAHNAAGLALVQDGLVIDLSEMHAVQVDPAVSTARAEGGATWHYFDAATTAHNLATTGGVISTTGVGGLTLGGGIGSLMRQHGLSCDNLIGASVVLASGDLVHTNAELRPDLFWALRGGGGNFGVVTELQFQLHPMNGMYGGMILHLRDAATAVLRNYRDVAEGAPDEMALFCALLHSPEGDPVAGYVTWFNGSESEAAGPMAPVKGFGSPIADLTGPAPYVAAQSGLDAGFPYGMNVYWKSHFLTGLPDDAIDVIVEYANKAPSKLTVTLLELLGGAVARVGADETAFGHRDAPFNLAIISRWMDPAEEAVNIAWTREFFDAMKPWSAGVYVNYLGTGDGAERVREAYSPAKYQRLVEVKRQYDPDNVFRRNQNIAP